MLWMNFSLEGVYSINNQCNQRLCHGHQLVWLKKSNVIVLFYLGQKHLPDFLSYSVVSPRHAHKISAGCCPGHFSHKWAAFFYSAVLTGVFLGTWKPSSGSPSSSLPVPLQAQLLQVFLKTSPASPRLHLKMTFLISKIPGDFAPLLFYLPQTILHKSFGCICCLCLMTALPSTSMPLLPGALGTCD